MSRSYTGKPSNARQANRARPNQLGENDDSEQNLAGSTQPPETEKCQRREAYTMIVPNEDKRRQLLQVQQKEEEIARQRKENKGKTPIKMTPKRVGGPNLPPEVVRTQQQQQIDKSPTLKALEMRQKREKWKQEKLDKEEQEIQEKKAAARLLAEKKEKKTSLQKETVRRHWDECYSNQQQSHQSSWDTQGNTNPEAYNTAHETDDDKLVELCRIYPECSPSSLMEVLLAEGSIEGVRQLLG